MNWKLEPGNLGSFLRLVVFLSVISLFGASASAQSAGDSSSRGREPFSAYDQALAAAADNALTGLTTNRREPAEKSPGTKAPERYKLSEEEQIQGFATRYWNGRVEDLQAAVLRIRGLRSTVEPILLAEGLPVHLAAVILVESAGRPTALSPRSARGLWQFIPATARRYGLNVDSARDERIDTEKATRAAARYLRDLYERFGDWPLALAAYNAGEQAVETAIRKAGAADFWVLHSQKLLPAETRNYVPAVLAAMELLGAETSDVWSRSETAQRQLPVLYAQVGTSE